MLDLEKKDPSRRVLCLPTVAIVPLPKVSNNNNNKTFLRTSLIFLVSWFHGEKPAKCVDSFYDDRS